jgi:transcriptional regulator with XRE-family HTH domain
MEAPYRYEMSGLDDVYLVGISVYWCERCRSGSPVIPKIEQLHTLIARHLVCKHSRLTGKELRFLRKNAGFPARQFAALVGVTPEHLSRFENGKVPHLGTVADRLARYISATKSQRNDVHRALMQMAENLLMKKRAVPAPRRSVFEVDNEGRWVASAA